MKKDDYQEKIKIKDLLGKSFTCSECGRQHKVETRYLSIGNNCQKELLDFLQKEGLSDLDKKGKGLIICDINTEKYGKLLANYIFNDFENLEKEGEASKRLFVFPQDYPHTDEANIGRLMQAMSDKPDYLLACGSGTITDLVRYCAYIADLPFIVYATAASVDGFASGSTPMIVDGFKITYPGKAPLGIFADTEILARAPRKMTAAGFGDVLAKIPGLWDWKLAAEVEGEAFCPFIYKLVKDAAEESLLIADKLIEADPEACGQLMEVLTITGLAMQMMGTTRPASGGEHQISHILEMRDLQEGRQGSLHGDKVGVASMIAIYLYGRLFYEEDPEKRRVSKLSRPEQKSGISKEYWESEIRRVYGGLADRALEINPSSPPRGEQWEKEKEKIYMFLEERGIDEVEKYYLMRGQLAKMIRDMGGPATADELGVSQEEIYDAVAFAKEVRPKYSILRIAESFGHLYDVSKEIAKKPEIVI